MSEMLKKLENDDIKVEVYEAPDGQTAVQLYKEIKPSVVFLDITMPVKNGLEALEEIIKFDNEAKVIMASSAGTKEHLKKAIDIGASDFIQKPIEEDKLITILNRILGL